MVHSQMAVPEVRQILAAAVDLALVLQYSSILGQRSLSTMLTLLTISRLVVMEAEQRFRRFLEVPVVLGLKAREEILLRLTHLLEEEVVASMDLEVASRRAVFMVAAVVVASMEMGELALAPVVVVVVAVALMVGIRITQPAVVALEMHKMVFSAQLLEMEEMEVGLGQVELE